MPDSIDVDVAIVGGGLVGASLALGLRDLGIDVLLIEGTAPGSSAQPSFDERTTALGNASRRIFEGLGVWADIAPQAAAIRTIHISDAGRFGFARLRAEEQGIDAFGYVVANRVIGAALWKKLPASRGIALRVPARPEAVEISTDAVRFTVVSDTGAREQVSARLVVAADGAHSSVRAAAGIDAEVEDYDQIAIVANVAADRPHDGTAYERFTPSGPLAVLPLYDGSYGVIWSCRPQDAAEVLLLDDDSYLRELQTRFGWRAGRFIRASRRASYPLKLTRAATTTAPRTVLIGNAAQALHPVAGQGFNLGLRDAAMLAEVIANAGAVHAGAGQPGAAAESTHARDDVAWGTHPPGTAAREDLGAPDLIRRFAQWRAADRSGVVRFTDGLVKLFGDPRPGMGLLRNLGLLMFDLAPPAKRALARVSAGFGGPTPRLARGLPVREAERP